MSSATLEERLRRLEDLEGIRILLSRYAAACDDNYNPAKAGVLFTEDATWDGGPGLGRYEGREAIQGLFAGASATFKWGTHFMISPETEVSPDGESARGTCYLLEACTIEEDGRRDPRWLTAIYDARYVKEDGDWRFAELNLDLRMFASHATGWVDQDRDAVVLGQ
jgi:uncharacterized protein (TIGR02246 family)